jgi:hypothetical protein
MKKSLVKIGRVTLTAGLSALVVNLCIVLTAELILGASMLLQGPHDPVPVKMPLANLLPESFAVALFSAGVYLLLQRFLSRPWPVFVFLVLMVTSLWTLGPVGQGQATATKVALSLTHFVIAGAILVSVNILFRGRVDVSW